ncbi:hypothetical protein OKW96_05565 [Sphingobacterium sp. KU25419]|nr:hypothetical protein OKW96_05565 [Sphingobacterium sp. KU25419]
MLNIVLLLMVVFFVNTFGIYYYFQLKNKQSNRLLLVVFLIILFQIFVGLLIRFSVPTYIHLFIAFPFNLIFGPIVLALFKLKNSKQLPTKYYLHFIPFFLAICCVIFLTGNVNFSYLYDDFLSIGNILSAVIYLSYLLWIGMRLDTKRERRWLGILKRTCKIVLSTESHDYVQENQITLEVSRVVQKTVLALPIEVEYMYLKKVETFITCKGYLDIDLNRVQFCEQLNIKKII